MSQSDFGTMDAAETSGIELAAILNAWRTALHSLHKGSSRPAYAIAGLLWIKDATDPWLLYIFDGAQDILIGSVNATTNVFMPSFGALSGILRADGSGGVAAATAAQIVAVIGALAVANAAHADTADSATTAGSAGTAAAISDGAVSTAAKIAANIITLAKLARTGTAGKPLLSGGSSADFYVGDFPASDVTSFNGRNGAVVLTNNDILGMHTFSIGGNIAQDGGAGSGSTTSNTTMVEIINKRVQANGTFRVTWNLARTGVAWNVWGQVYKNGVAYGVKETTSSTSAVGFTTDITVDIGDTIQMFAAGYAGTAGAAVNITQIGGDIAAGLSLFPPFKNEALGAR